MLKIDYPTNSKDLDNLHDFYYKTIVEGGGLNEESINKLLKQVVINGKALSLKKLLITPFDELENVYQSVLNKIGLRYFTDLRWKFNYAKNQGRLAFFFMNQSNLNVNSCFYCNIDFINAFKDFGDYSSGKDFVNNADFYELQNVKGIGDRISNQIISKRKSQGYFNFIHEVPVSKKSRKIIELFDFDKTHNQFTLDHVLPQSKYKLLSLCLYNLIPSCYSCNSKFKKAKTFSSSVDLAMASPSSKDFSINNNFEFKIIFSDELKDIRSINDFKLMQDVYSNQKMVDEYFKMFKIPGRYVYHKEVAFRLIEKKRKYPESNLLLISKLLNYSLDEIRSDVYGEELFRADLSTQPLTKFKRDIARNIAVKNVLKS